MASSAPWKKKDKGRVAPTGTVGTGMHFVRMRPNKLGGFHIVLATNRPITFAELYNSTRSRDCPPGSVVFEVDKDGKGTGTLAPPARSASTKRTNLRSNITGRSPSASPTSIAKSNFHPTQPACSARSHVVLARSALRRSLFGVRQPCLPQVGLLPLFAVVTGARPHHPPKLLTLNLQLQTSHFTASCSGNSIR